MQKLNDNIYYIGVNDRTTHLFESMWPLPKGVSYNSYLIDDEKVAVVDCVGQDFFEEYLQNIREVIADRKIDYIIVNHMEPDHSGALQLFRQFYPDAKIVGNKKTLEMVGGYYGVSRPDDVVVADGTSLSLGKHELVFSLIPMVHWPETMVTYDKTTSTLFSGDAFGCFGALNGAVLDCYMNVEPYFPEMRRYYSNIVGKYGAPVQSALKKLASVDLKMVCSTHGPVWTENIERVVAEYDRMSRYEAAEGITVVYASMYGNTRRMAESVAAGAAKAGIKNINVFDAARTPLSYILESIFTYKGLAVGATTYNGSTNPAVVALLKAISLRGVKNRVFGAFGSFTWSGKAIKEILATNKFKIEHKDILWDNTNLGKGKKVMVFNPETSKQLAECTITDYEPLNYREGIVTLDKNVAEADTKTCLYLQSDEEAVITGCTLGTQLQRGILTHQPTKVTNCTIEDNGLAFELALLSGGIEGPPTQKLTIENCIFRNLVWGGISVNCPSHDYNQKGTPQLVVKNNIFDLRHNIPLVSAVNSNGVSFTGNKIITKKANVAEASLFRLINTPVLENSNNLYTSQP